jgi:multiple sugar transport system substrate-binding protein
VYRERNTGRGRWIRKGGVAGIAAAAGLLLAACGGSSGGSSGSATPSAGQNFKGQTLTVFDGAPSGPQATQWKEYYNYLSTQFHKATGATINWEYYSSGSQLSSKIEASVVSGSGPDVFSYGSSYIGVIGATHNFVTLTPSDWTLLGGRSSFVAKQLEDSGYSANQDIGIPYESIPFVIAYNKSEFAKAGITSPPTTWTQWVTDAKKIQVAEPGVYGAGFDPSDPYDPWKFVWSYTHQLGGRFVAANGKSASMDSSQVKQALAFYFGWDYKYHIVPPQSLSWNSSQLFTAFSQGKVAMIPLADYGTQVAAAGTKVAGHIGFAPLPSVPYGMSARPSGGEPAETIVSGNYWAIPKYSAGKTRLALEFAKISVTPAAQVKQFQLLGWMPVTSGGITAVEKAAGSSVTSFISAEKNSLSTAITPAWSYVEDGMEAVINHIASNLATSHSYSASYVNSQLAAEQADVSSHLSS